VRPKFRKAPAVAALILALGLGGRAIRADELITNGGFEAGFAGWTLADALGSGEPFAIQTGTTSPVNGLTVPPPPGGTQAAMTDAQAPGSHVLYQDFVVPSVVPSATIRFDRYINNLGGEFFSPDTLDYTSVNNQQARVDILTAGSDPFSVGATDVLMNLFQTQPGDPLESGYSALSFDVTALLAAHAGETLRLRFAEADNQFILLFGVDQVSLNVVPEPSSLIATAIGGLLVLGLAVRRRGRSIPKPSRTDENP
jgi:hypothetical protein